MAERKAVFQKIRADRARVRRQRRQNRVGILCVSCIVCLLLVGMSVQIFSLKQTEASYRMQEQELSSRFRSEEERKVEIQKYEAYTKTRDYIEETAKTKLGLVYPNEIIFKEVH